MAIIFSFTNLSTLNPEAPALQVFHSRFTKRNMQIYKTSQLSIIDAGNLKNKAIVARQVLRLYEETFSSYGSEFEATENILGRLESSGSRNIFQPDTYLLAYISEESSTVTGGIIFEYYRSSGCGLLTYIFTRNRRKGLGEFLINEGLDWMLNRQLKLSLQAVFFETENPLIYKNDQVQLDGIFKRLRFFKFKARAKVVDIPYVQPSLSAGQDRVYSLLLMTLPKFSSNSFNVLMDKEIIKKFILEFYNELLVAASLAAGEKEYEEFRNFHQDPDLLRIELSLDIADLAENVDPFGDMEHSAARKLHWLNQKIWESFYRKQDRENADMVVLDLEREFREILKSSPVERDDTFFLREIPTFVPPRMALKRCSLAFHLVDLAESEKQVAYCPFFHSYEKDLFSQRFHSLNSPYYSKCYEKGIVEISFLNTMEFTSEGRYEKVVLTDPEQGTIPMEPRYTKKLQYFLNYVYFNSSRITVWEIVFTPADGDFFHEYEILQLSKYFAGRHEKYKPGLIFSRPDKKEEEFRQEDRIFEYLSVDSRFNVPELVSGSSRIREDTLELKAGTLQVETSQCYFINPGGLQQIESSAFKAEINDPSQESGGNFWPFFYKTIRSFHLDQEDKYHFELYFKEVEKMRILFSTFCGFCTGIFDFNRLEDEEISDTMIPRQMSATDSAFIVMNRGVMASFCHEDNLYESVRDNIGMSPYLLIPNSVLVHNAVIAEMAENEILAESKINGRNEGVIKQIFLFGLRSTYKRKSTLLSYIEKKITLDIVPNVFQYPTEIDLYEYGMERRGINAIILEVEKKKNNLSLELERISKIQSDLFELRITLLIVGLTILQVAEILGFNREGIGFKILVVILSLMALVYFYYRKYTSRL